MRGLSLVLLLGCSGAEVETSGETRDATLVLDLCNEGDLRCLGEAQQRCEGGAWVNTGSTQGCALPCAGGDCGDDDPCFEAARNRSYIGCEYWPVDLDNAVEVFARQPDGNCRNNAEPRDLMLVCWNAARNAPQGLCDVGQACPDGTQCQPGNVCVLDAQGSPFAIVVSNPNAEAATVTLQDAGGARHEQPVAPGEVTALYPQELGFPDHSLDHTGQTANAYRLTSDLPIVAYQFNPLDNEFVFSNDGSLLIPAHAYDTVYLALTQATLTRRPNTNDYNGYVTVVASAPGTTTVEVTASAATRAGGGVPAMAAGETRQFALAQYEVLNLESGPDEDLTGTRVTSVDGTPFGMFVGHEALVIRHAPIAQPCCADHIEEQLFPVSTWGKAFAIARTQQRTSEPDLVRVLAARNGTTLTFDPAPAEGRCGTLASGESCDVRIQRDTTIDASEPVLVGQFLLSTDGQAGDPALAFAVPFEQFREAYTFLVPAEYDDQYISVVAAAGAPVTLDGEDVSGQLAPFGAGFAGGRVRVSPGQRRLECPGTCGVLVYGYSQAVSYLFAGGLDLEQITVP